MTRDNKERLSEKIRVNRRKFLERTGVAAGIGAFGIQTVGAAEPQGKLRYTEVGIEHETELDKKSWEEDYLSLTFTDRVGHYVEAEHNLFHVLPYATEEERRLFKQSESLVDVDGYRPLPVTEFRPQETAELVTEIGVTLRPINGVGLAAPYAPPAFTVREASEDIVIASSNGQERVSPNTETVHQLPTQEVEVQTRTVTEETMTSSESIKGYPDETEQNPVVEIGTELLSIKPRVVVRNHGKLDVVVDPKPEHAWEER